MTGIKLPGKASSCPSTNARGFDSNSEIGEEKAPIVCFWTEREIREDLSLDFEKVLRDGDFVEKWIWFCKKFEHEKQVSPELTNSSF